MKNYSRTAMLIPFTEYQKKVAEKQQSDKDSTLIPDKFENVKPEAIIGQIYPDLCSQAAYINKDIDDMKSKISESVKNLFGSMGEEAINFVLDSVYQHVDKFLDLPNFSDDADKEYSFTKEGLYDLSSKVFLHIDLAKALLDLYIKNDRMKTLHERQELTQQNILL